MATGEQWATAEAAFAAGMWRQAAASFAALTAADDDPRALERLAQAAWWLDDAKMTLGAREDAYRGFRAAGDARGAARAAAALGYDSILFGRGAAVGRGWLTRASDLLGEQRDVPEAGWLAVRQAEVALNVDHDPVEALSASTRACEIADRVGAVDGDLAIVGRALTGLSRVRQGDVSGGMPFLDGAAAAATGGDVRDLMWTGKICCWLISACQDAHDLERAAQWCVRVQEICVERHLAPLFLVCRTQYAAILFECGDASGAESALLEVLEGLDRSSRLTRLDAVAQLGELRRRQGRLAQARDLLEQSTSPKALMSLARLDLDEGHPGRAWSTIEELLRSLPSGQLWEQIDALAVAVEAGAAAGLRTGALAAASHLRELAAAVGTPAVLGQADAADARLASGVAAVEAWQDAARRFRSAGLVFYEADARRQLAAALRAMGDLAGARQHEDYAVAELGRLLGAPEGLQARGLLTARQRDVLRLVARGLTNGAIASRLQISEHTVHRHLANIFDTLDVTSRTAAAAYAVTHGLG